MTTKSTKPYISNPFKSSFDGFNKLFKLSQTPAIVILIVSFVGSILNILSSLPTPQSSTPNTTTTTNEAVAPALIIAIVIGVSIAVIISVFVSVVYTGIVNYVVWKTSRNESTTIGEAFHETMKRFWRILLIQIVVGIKVFIGTLALIVPGVRAALRYQMVFVTMFDENLDAWKSMDRIKLLTKKHLLEVFGILTVSQLLFPVAILIQMGGESVLYPQLKHLKDNNLPKPPTHWLNYLGFMLIAVLVFGLLMLISLIGFIIAASNA